MYELTFACDPNKDETNLEKHGVSFEEAQTVFQDDNARLIYDPDHSMTEDLLLGLSAQSRLLVVSHTYRKNEKEIRIISARSATKKELNEYHGFLR
jgi:uncharacterized DUF497 family protein